MVRSRAAGATRPASTNGCRFGDVSYFYRAFRRRYGLLATDVRAQAMN